MVMNASSNVPSSVHHDDRMVSYVIEQNQTLHTEIEKMKEEQKELKTEMDSLEHDNDSMQTSKTVCIGYLKNMSETNKVRLKLSDEYRIMYTHLRTMYIATIFAMIAFNTIVLSVTNLALQVGYSTLFSALVSYFGRASYIKHAAHTSRVAAMMETLAALEKATDLVMDLFDNM